MIGSGELHTDSVEIPTVICNALERLFSDRATDASMPGVRAGVFEVGRLLGRGGMGVVYEAFRSDGEVRQRAVVKFAQTSPVAGDPISRGALRRFERERQILASLRHPYIAGLIDAGTTDEGIPYAVIEQVDGEPIDAFCDARCLDLRDRIGLVLKLCDGVQFAHRNLIVHSDIKPDNVLVTPDGIPKLIDFGIATELGPDATATTMRAFTPAYASPESAAGAKATVTTDVYGLGSVLYRLVTGSAPRNVAGSTLEQAVVRIREEDVIRPSAVRPELRGDLENILLKALHRDPQRRYGSVPEFAADLRRFLERRPVVASPDTLLYRTSRFALRHWAPLTAVLAVIAALSVTAAVALNERHRALRRAAESRRLAETLLFDVYDEIGGMVGGTKAREKLGRLSVHYLEALEKEYGPDPALAWELVNAYSRLAQSRGGSAASTGDAESGAKLAREALRIGAALESDAPVDRPDELFRAYARITPVFEESGLRGELRDAIHRMVRLARSLPPLRQAQAQKELARYLDDEGQPRDAALALESAVRTLRPLLETQPPTPGADAELISVLVGLGRVRGLTGELPAAVASLREAIRRSEAKVAADPHTVRSVRQLYWSHLVLGDVLGLPLRPNLGRPQEAAAHYRTARAIAQKLADSDPGNEMARVDLARTFAREGLTMADLDPAEALGLLGRAQVLTPAASPQSYAGAKARLQYLTATVRPLVRLGQLDRALARASEARSLFESMRKAGWTADEKALLRAEAECSSASLRASANR